MHDRFVTPVFFIVSALTGCGGDAVDGARTDAESAATASDGAAEAAQLGAWFSDTAALNPARATVGEARALMTAAAEGEILAAVSPPSCVAVTTDNQTYVQATFTGCTGPGGRASMSGSVRGELSFDTTPCGPAMCPTAVRWTIAAALTHGDGGEGLDGDLAVVAPLAAGAVRTLEATLSITSRRGDTVEAGADATWTADEAGCATVSGSASVTGEASGTVAVTGLVTCPDACPTAGTVAMNGGGRTLSFTYDGSSTITVVTGTGESFELPLLCGR